MLPSFNDAAMSFVLGTSQSVYLKGYDFVIVSRHVFNKKHGKV